jgi:hypothetical protein
LSFLNSYNSIFAKLCKYNIVIRTLSLSDTELMIGMAEKMDDHCHSKNKAGGKLEVIRGIDSEEYRRQQLWESLSQAQ